MTLAALARRPGGEAPRIGVLPYGGTTSHPRLSQGSGPADAVKFLEWIRAKARARRWSSIGAVRLRTGRALVLRAPEHLVLLTDDCAPMEKLQARSLALARKGWD